jgi:hypothetical protein
VNSRPSLVKPQNSVEKLVKMLKKASCILLKPSIVQQMPSRQRWNSLRYQYLKKAPIIRVDPDGTYHVEGVSNKQTPIPVLWREPVKSN